MNDIRLTSKGKTVLVIFMLVFATTFTAAIRDVCWVGSGYGSCKQMYESSTKYQVKENT